MDNLTHSFAGWALGQAGLKTTTRKGLAALILGANAPDIDVFFGSAPWEPLATHRGFTHSLVGGVIILPLMLAGLLLLLDRWQVRRGKTFKSGLAMHRGWLIALCYLGALTHPLLDLLTTYSVQLFTPLTRAWYHADGLFIIDVWLWSLFGLAIGWSRHREKQRRPGFRRPAQAALAVALAYIGVNLAISGQATAAVRARSPQATAIFASPDPVLSWRRTMAWREGRNFGGAAWTPMRGLGPSQPLQPDGLDDPVVRAAIAASSDLQTFMRWSVMPMATVVRDGCTATVFLGDARYAVAGSRRSRLNRETRIRVCA